MLRRRHEKNAKPYLLLKVEGMSCQYCARSVESAVERVRGVRIVKVDLAHGTVWLTVGHSPANFGKIENLVNRAGLPWHRFKVRSWQWERKCA